MQRPVVSIILSAPCWCPDDGEADGCSARWWHCRPYRSFAGTHHPQLVVFDDGEAVQILCWYPSLFARSAALRPQQMVMDAAPGVVGRGMMVRMQHAPRYPIGLRFYERMAANRALPFFTRTADF